MIDTYRETGAMPRMIFRFLCLMSVAAFLGFVSAMPADAGSRELKATGAVGETVDGYLGTPAGEILVAAGPWRARRRAAE